MASARSSYINLYSTEDVTDNAFKVRLENKQAEVSFTGAVPLKFDFGGNYSFIKSDDSAFDLEGRFVTLESDPTGADNAAAITALQAADAAEAVSRIAGDTTNANGLAAEITARTTADAAIQAEVDAEEVRAAAAEAANGVLIAAEVADRTAADASEAARAAAAEVALGTRIDNVLSNADPAALDSLSELLTAYEAADASLATSIVDALARVTILEDRVDELTNA
jgi:hypothetical protein